MSEFIRAFYERMSAPSEPETGRVHDWGKCQYVGYHPPEKLPSWVPGIGYAKPIVKYTCKACGKSVQGDGGGSFLIDSLGRETCPGNKP